MRQRNAHLQIRPAHQTRAVERLGALGAPHVRAADARERVIHHRAVRRNRHRRDIVRICTSDLRRRRLRRLGAIAVLHGFQRRFRLFVKLLENGLHGSHLLLRLVLDALGLLGCLLRRLLLQLELLLVGGHLVAQGLGLLDHALVVLVERVVHVQARGELLERRRAHEQVDHSELAGLVHAHGAFGQAILQRVDLRGSLVDAALRVVDGVHGRLVLVKRLVVGLCRLGQLVLQRCHALIHGVGLRQLLLGVGLVVLLLLAVGVLFLIVLVIGPSGNRAEHRGCAEQRGSGNEQATIDLRTETNHVTPLKRPCGHVDCILPSGIVIHGELFTLNATASPC